MQLNEYKTVNYVYAIVNQNNEIQTICPTYDYAKEYAHQYYNNYEWRVDKYRIIEITYDSTIKCKYKCEDFPI